MGILKLQLFADVRVFNKNAAFLCFFLILLRKKKSGTGKIDERFGYSFSIIERLQLISSSKTTTCLYNFTFSICFHCLAVAFHILPY